MHAARRARSGLALQDFLQAFRTYHGVVWRVLMEIVEEHELSGRATLEAARPVMDYIDLAATRWRGYRGPATAAGRGDRLPRLPGLRGRPASGSAAAAARRRGRPMPSVGSSRSPVDRDEDELALRARASALAGPHRAPRWRR